MKKLLTILTTAALITPSAFAATSTTKKSNLNKVKKEQIQKLERKKETIEKRISCIKKAQSKSELKECAKKYPLIKKKKHTKKKMKKKKSSKKNKKK